MKTPRWLRSRPLVFLGGLASGLCLFFLLRSGTDGDPPTKADVDEVFGLLEDDAAALGRALDPSAPRIFQDPADITREVDEPQASARKADLEAGAIALRRNFVLLLRQALARGRGDAPEHHEHVVFTAEKSGETFPWKVPAGTVAGQATISNAGPSIVDAVRILIDGKAMPPTLQELVAGAVQGARSDEQKAIGLWNAVVAGRVHDWPAHREAADPLKLLHVYGYGFCSHAANALALLAREAGLESRVLQAKGKHVVAEIKINGQWCMLDADGEMFARRPDGTIASVDDIRSSLALLDATPRGFYSAEKLREIYRDGDFKVRKLFHPEPTRALNTRLRPGESLGYSTRRNGLFYLTRYLEEPVEYANGTWTFTPVWENGAWLIDSGGTRNLEAVRDAVGSIHLAKSDPRQAAELIYPFEIPYPVLDGRILLDGEGAPPHVEISRDGKTWQDLPVTPANDGDLVVSLSPFLSMVGEEPDYRFAVRLQWPATAARVRLSRLHFHYDLQMAPRQLPLPGEGTKSVGVLFDASGPATLGLDFAVQTKTAE